MYCISVSHKKAPVSIREKFAFTLEEKKVFTSRIMQESAIFGCVIVCTCNRSEIYISGERDSVSVLQKRMVEFKGVLREELLQYFNIYSGERAIAHLFKVCCGFDSMVLGEDEILGQVKEAYQACLAWNAGSYELNVLFQRAITCSKKIKTSTNLSKTPLSIATLVANEVFQWNSSEEKKVLVIGMTGKMGMTITKNIVSKSGIKVIGTVRSHKVDFQMELKSNQVQVIDYKDRYYYLNQSDIIISATSGPHYTLTCEEVEKVIVDQKPRLFIDVAVPLDLDPEIGTKEKTTLYDIDFFETLSKNNGEIKLKELDFARAMMEEELDSARKEVLFHPYIGRLSEFGRLFQEYRFETLLFKIRDHVSSEELNVILSTLEQLQSWIVEE